MERKWSVLLLTLFLIGITIFSGYFFIYRTNWIESAQLHKHKSEIVGNEAIDSQLNEILYFFEEWDDNRAGTLILDVIFCISELGFTFVVLETSNPFTSFPIWETYSFFLQTMSFGLISPIIFFIISLYPKKEESPVGITISQEVLIWIIQVGLMTIHFVVSIAPNRRFQVITLLLWFLWPVVLPFCGSFFVRKWKEIPERKSSVIYLFYLTSIYGIVYYYVRIFQCIIYYSDMECAWTELEGANSLKFLLIDISVFFVGMLAHIWRENGIRQAVTVFLLSFLISPCGSVALYLVQREKNKPSQYKNIKE